MESPTKVLERKNTSFWLTQKDANGMSDNEKSFYTTFQRKQDQGSRFFEGTKKQTIGKFMKDRLKSAKQT